MSNSTFIVSSSLFSLALMVVGAVWNTGLCFAFGIWLGFLSISGLVMWSGDYTLKALLKEVTEDND